MNTLDWIRLRKEMEAVQGEKRYEHTLGVEFTAASLAMCHGADKEKAQLAGLLHDCAKKLSGEELIAVCQSHQLPISEVEYAQPQLLHAKAGSCFAKEKYGVADKDVLNAIYYHTTGRPEMSLLEKIVFIADYMEPGRNKAEHLDEIRKEAFQDIDTALLHILSDTLAYLKSEGGAIDAMTQETYDYYKEERREKHGK